MNTYLARMVGNRGLLVLAAALATTAVASNSYADTAAPQVDQAPSLRVRYADLDLATDQGARSLYGRIERAARNVCPDFDSKELSLQAAGRACRNAAVARAVNDVHSSRLAMLHASSEQHG